MKNVENHRQGINIAKELAPFLLKKMSQLEAIFPEIIEYTTEYVLGDLYNREGLSMREKLIIGFTICITNGLKGNITGYTKHLLHEGVSYKEIMDILIHISGYAGFPAVWEALGSVQEAFDHPQD